MNKNSRLFVRVSDEEKKKFMRAARNHKNLSAFLLSTVRRVVRFQVLIEEAERLYRRPLRPLKISAMRVVEK